jgi:hypothetical protein
MLVMIVCDVSDEDVGIQEAARRYRSRSGKSSSRIASVTISPSTAQSNSAMSIGWLSYRAMPYVDLVTDGRRCRVARGRSSSVRTNSIVSPPMMARDLRMATGIVI